MVVLLLRLGLRAAEVATLRPDELDWRAGQVKVHGKGGRVDELPLPVDVGEAITGYLRHGRPRVEVRKVFLRVAPPTVGLTRSGVSSIVRLASAQAGLTPFGAHRLRDTAASDSFAAGANVKVVQTMLGHKFATMTLDLYGHLFADQLDEVADAMDAARTAADCLRTSGPVVYQLSGKRSLELQ